MKWIAAVAFATIAAIALMGCSRNSVPPSQYMNSLPKDVVDRDFVATISETSKPMVYKITIRKVNRTKAKWFSQKGIMAGFALKDGDGKRFEPDVVVPGNPYARTVDGTFEPGPPTTLVESYSGKIRLVPKDLKPGIYTIEPRARIQEYGKHALRGVFPDMGYVSVYPGNALKVTIGKSLPAHR